MSKRSNFYKFYKNKQLRSGLFASLGVAGLTPPTLLDLQTPEQYKFKGEQTVASAVVRVDLNGYSQWAKDKTLAHRRDLLSHFFSDTVVALDNCGGVYLRDEGDCLVALFSSYFTGTFDPQSIKSFCSRAVSNTYGRDNLSAKATVAIGSIAIYQKAHESTDDEWSAEGEPFVRVSRLENSIISSKACVYYFEEDYDNHFRALETYVAPGQIYHWEMNSENLQIPGLNLPSGWAKIVTLEYLPSGRY